jgi:hypothetical protein
MRGRRRVDFLALWLMLRSPHLSQPQLARIERKRNQKRFCVLCRQGIRVSAALNRPPQAHPTRVTVRLFQVETALEF